MVVDPHSSLRIRIQQFGSKASATYSVAQNDIFLCKKVKYYCIILDHLKLMLTQYVFFSKKEEKNFQKRENFSSRLHWPFFKIKNRIRIFILNMNPGYGCCCSTGCGSESPILIVEREIYPDPNPTFQVSKCANTPEMKENFKGFLGKYLPYVMRSFERFIDIFWKRHSLAFQLFEMDTDLEITVLLLI